MAQIVEMAAYSVAVLVRFTALQQNKLSQEQIEVLCSEEALYIMRTNVSAYEYLVELAQKKNIDANEIKNFCSKRMRPLLFRGSISQSGSWNSPGTTLRSEKRANASHPKRGPRAEQDGRPVRRRPREPPVVMVEERVAGSGCMAAAFQSWLHRWPAEN